MQAPLDAALAHAIRDLDEDALAALVTDVLRLEGFAHPTDAPLGSLSAERVETRHGEQPNRVRWIVRAVPAAPDDGAVVAAVRAAEQDLYACASRRMMLWFAGPVPPIVARMNEHLPSALHIETRSGDWLVRVLRRTPALRARHVPSIRSEGRGDALTSAATATATAPGAGAPPGLAPLDGWRVLFLHDGSPMDYQLLRRLEEARAFVVAANLAAKEAARAGLPELVAEGWDFVVGLAGDLASTSLAEQTVEALAHHLEHGGDVLWNPWAAWAARHSALSALGPLLPVELDPALDETPLAALIEQREMRVAEISAQHQATRRLTGIAPFAFVNSYEPLRLARGATALASSDDGTPLLAVAGRGHGRSVYLNASVHSCVGLAIRWSPFDDAPPLLELMDATLSWLHETMR